MYVKKEYTVMSQDADLHEIFHSNIVSAHSTRVTLDSGAAKKVLDRFLNRAFELGREVGPRP